MTRAIVPSLIITFALASAAAATTMEIPLPALRGTYGCVEYSCPTSRTASFQLGMMPDTIYAVWIRLSGTVAVGQDECWYGDPPPWPVAVGMELMANMFDSLNSHWWSADRITPEVNGSFSFQEQFFQLLGATWEFLEAGRGEVKLTGFHPGTIPECFPITYPVATITEAILVVEFDSPISTENETWGAIKSLFR